MKKTFGFLFLLYQLTTIIPVNGQAGEWVWIHGSNTSGSSGTFGSQGVSSPANMPPGCYETCEWKDLNDNLWLFGGLNSSFGTYGDLWKYDPLINEWTWMKGSGFPGASGNYGTIGVPSATSNPPSRAWGMASWVDNQGKFWMYGGYGSVIYADLWRYDPTTNEWTWMQGPSGSGTAVYGTQGVPDPANSPGSRYECASAWTDNAGDLWLFGGYSGGISYNDLWKYSIANNEWTWMKGSAGPGGPGVYGIQGVEDPANTPGARQAYCHWKDAAGNLWLFAGYDYSGGTLYNDLWRFNPVTNNWTWMMGGTSNGNYGTQCVLDSVNIPDGRFENRACVVAQDGNFWLFGGGNGTSFQNTYNDLWKYCVAANQWSWISGDNTSNPSGNWGTLGVSSPLNKPNGRGGAVAWSGQNSTIYLFGGTDEFWPNMYNDLWKYTIDTTCASCLPALPVAIFSAPNDICPGTCTDFTNLSIGATSFLWSFPGATPSTSTDVNPSGICYNSPGNYSVSLIATNANGSDTITLNNYITVFPYPAPQGILQNGDTLFANQGAVSYQWYHSGNLIPGATDYFYVATEGGNYNVVATDINGCEVEAAIFDVIASVSVTGLQNSLSVYPNPAGDKIIIRHNQIKINAVAIKNAVGELVVDYHKQPSGIEIEIDIRMLPAGIYFLEAISEEKIYKTKIIKK